MKRQKYRSGGKVFGSLEAAKVFAEAEFKKSGVVLGIEAVKRMSKAEKLAERIDDARISRAISRMSIPMLSIPALYRALEAALAEDKSDEELRAIVAAFPGVEAA